VKMNTEVWLKCESKGRPAHTLKTNCSTREAILAIAKWLGEVYMGSHIDIRIARTELELAQSTQERRATKDGDMMAELESMLAGGTPEGDNDHINQAALEESIMTIQNQIKPVCPHGQPLSIPCLECRVEHNKATM
jgi:hypothetical protein